MKKTLFAFLMFAQLGFGQSLVKISILGMVCPLCSRGLTKGFNSVESIQSVNVDMDNQLVTLTLKEGKSISDKKIKEVVENAGVNVKTIQR